MKTTSLSVRDVLVQDFWLHLGGVILIGLGVAYWIQANSMHGAPPELALGFIGVGVATMGVKIINGSSAALRNAMIAQSLIAGQPMAQRSSSAAPGGTLPPAATPEPATIEHTSQQGGTSSSG